MDESFRERITPVALIKVIGEDNDNGGIGIQVWDRKTIELYMYWEKNGDYEVMIDSSMASELIDALQKAIRIVDSKTSNNVD